MLVPCCGPDHLCSVACPVSGGLPWVKTKLDDWTSFAQGERTPTFMESTFLNQLQSLTK